MTITPRNGSSTVHETAAMSEKPKYVESNHPFFILPTHKPVTSAPLRIRWWLPGSAVSYDTLTTQLESVKRAGFSGVEVAFLGNGGGKPGLRDEDKWADKDGKWKRMVEFIWQECERLGMSADLTIGPAFPAMVPGLSPDSPGSAKELVYGQSTRSYTEGEAADLSVLPTPTATEAGRTPANPVDQTARLNLIAVYAVRAVVDGEQTVQKDRGSMMIDVAGEESYHDSVLDITGYANGTGMFTFPSHTGKNSRWIVIAVYYCGTLQSKSHFEQNADTYTQELAHVVDHLSEDGVRALAEYYEKHILDENIKAAFRRLGSNLFEDSLELSQIQYWTPALLQEFEQRRGYDLQRFLPLILDEAKHHPFAPPFKTFKLSDSNEKTCHNGRSLRDRVRHDFALVVSDLYLEKRLIPLKGWANSIGLALRNQPYGIDFDAAVAATKVDIVEGETLCFWGNDDSFRVLATGRDVAGGKILSQELAASMHKHYALSWHDIIRMANRDFALGVNQVIMHGLPYPETDHSEWPGYMPFLPAGKLPGFGDAWGERQPQWSLSSGYTNYLQNVQHVLQLGRAIVDIGIYHGATEGVKGGLKDTALSEAGFTYGFPSDGLLAREDAVVKEGKLWYGGPGYKAFVLNNVAFIQLPTLEKIVLLANQGLPIVLVGDGPVTSAGLARSDNEQAEDDDFKIATLLSNLKNNERCLLVDNVGQVPGALNRLKVLPSLECTGDSNRFLVAVREDTNYRYYYVHNTSDSVTESPVRIHAPNYTDPVVLSLWDRNQPKAMQYAITEYGHIEVDIQLPPKGSTIIRLTKSQAKDTSLQPSPVPQTRSVTSQVDLLRWNLELESWEPASKQDTSTVLTNKHVTNIPQSDGIRTWSELEGLQHTSGIAVYETTFENPMDEQGAISSVALDIDGLDDAFDVAINDQAVFGIDRLRGRHEITDYLRPGENKLRITVGTTLNNRLKQVYPKMFEGRASQVHGIKGPVKLVLYN